MAVRFATYGNDKFRGSRERLAEEARATGWFGTITAYTPEALSARFRASASATLMQEKGGGYWAWKTDVLLQELAASPENGLVVYLDAGCTLNPQGERRFREYLAMARANEPGIVSFAMPHLPEEQWITREVFAACSSNISGGTQIPMSVRKSGQLVGGVLVLRNSPAVREIVEQCRRVADSDFRLLTDQYNQGQIPTFKEGRHDQSVFSVVRKLHGCVVVPRDESWVPPFGSRRSLAYPFWATRRRE
jgi:hypothetical protein